ncbi:MAG: hypothetical protein JWO31_1802, partial [Phycisphaerales bacterium]|nr:hypothetical protein [Phycisphaerales bacterium]
MIRQPSLLPTILIAALVTAAVPGCKTSEKVVQPGGPDP